jgi:hypothetical protein
LFPAAGTARNSSILYREVNLLVGYSEQDRWIGELPGALKNSVGFEYFGKVSNDFGDYLTYDLQARLGYHTDLASDEAWGIEIHNAWAEYKLGLGKSLRVGHFPPAFGLEHNVDTHGTLLQTLAGTDVGFKKDWGGAYRGGVGPLDYSIALQLGSGMPIKRVDGSYLATARIGTPQGRDLEWGVSILRGDVLKSSPMRTIPEPEIGAEALSKRRVGLDVQYSRGPVLLRAETTIGRNEREDVRGALFQADYTVPSIQSLTAQVQGRFWTDRPGEVEASVASVALGGSYTVSPGWTLRAGVFHDIEKPENSEDTRVYVQAYYLGR